VIAVAAFFVATDITITNVALPSIGTELGASTSALQWVMDAYNITLAGLLLLGGALGERFSRKWVFLAGLSAFGVGSLLAGLSPNVGFLIGARVVMGIGAAMLLTPALSLIAGLFAPSERAKAIGVWATAGAAGLAAGPILGGALIQFLDWHWIFLVNVPFMAVVVLLGVRAIPDSQGDRQEKLDIPGAVLSVAGFTMLLGAIIEAPRFGWTNPFILGVGALGVLVLALFVMWEMHTPAPMFHFEVLGYPAVAGAAIALFVTYVSFTGTLFLVPQHLDAIERLDTLSVGLALIPFRLGFLVDLAGESEACEDLGNRQGHRCGPAVHGCRLRPLGTHEHPALGAVGRYRHLHKRHRVGFQCAPRIRCHLECTSQQSDGNSIRDEHALALPGSIFRSCHLGDRFGLHLQRT
jgi:EmrB/QacA subfamily drug resistance transporter